MAIETSLIPREGNDGGDVLLSILEYQSDGPLMFYDGLNIHRSSNPKSHPDFQPIAYSFIKPEMIRDKSGETIKISFDQLLDVETWDPMNNTALELNPGKLYAVGLHVKGEDYKIPYTEGARYKTPALVCSMLRMKMDKRNTLQDKRT
ncbi:MAG: hypothetical protein EA411_11865 [Saprospirales bacterium]|nr:MAG: hypothetical protein EA411_11865 [Saprospirales bacterium]